MLTSSSLPLLSRECLPGQPLALPREGSWISPSPPSRPAGVFWALLCSSSSDWHGGCSQMCQVRLHSFQISRNSTGGFKRRKKKPTHHKKHPKGTKGKKIQTKTAKNYPKSTTKDPRQKQKLNPTKTTPLTNKPAIFCLL